MLFSYLFNSFNLKFVFCPLGVITEEIVQVVKMKWDAPSVIQPNFSVTMVNAFLKRNIVILCLIVRINLMNIVVVWKSIIYVNQVNN